MLFTCLQKPNRSLDATHGIQQLYSGKAKATLMILITVCFIISIKLCPFKQQPGLLSHQETELTRICSIEEPLKQNKFNYLEPYFVEEEILAVQCMS